MAIGSARVCTDDQGVELPRDPRRGGRLGAAVRTLGGLTAAVVVACAGAVAAGAAELHIRHCLHGCPAGAPATNDVVVRPIYVLSSNDATKFADWVAYRVTRATIGPTAERRWRADPVLAEAETLERDDYRDANRVLGTDRGHQAPLASFTGTPHWEATNLLSNVTPQRSALNRGPWARLEAAVRELAWSRDSAGVHVATGPLYEREMPPMPGADESHAVPSGYWKIVAVQGAGGVRAAGFVFDQDTPAAAGHCGEAQQATVREIERRTGLDFFHGLTRNRQDAIEATRPALLKELGC